MNKSSIGRMGENRASSALLDSGFTIVERNFRSRIGEIDIIAKKEDILVFVEVKTWTQLGFENIEYAVNRTKRRRIIETAKFFLSTHREYNSMALRFDLIFIDSEKLHHLESAFTERV